MWSSLVSPSSRPFDGWNFLPSKVATAFPWFLAGATASTLLAHLLGGDARRTLRYDRWRDAIVFGCGLGLAAACSQGLQMSLDYDNLDYLQIISKSGAVGLAGGACGMVIGYLVPKAHRYGIVTPLQLEMERALAGLRQRAQSALGDVGIAENWIFTPHNELGGISPAEAIQYKSQVNRVSRLLDGEPPQKLTTPPLRIAS